MATSARPTQPASAPQPGSAPLPASGSQRNTSAATRNGPRAAPPDTKVKQLSFAFPFLKKGQRDTDAAVKFTDEHEIYQLLADREPGGSFLVSKNGFWHGGIHVTENGAGTRLDLKQGIRCIADGHVIAYRVNRTYPVSQFGDAQAPYSTGFALVRHAMEFPKGNTLTFYSLYMHLQAYDEYERDTTKAKPAFWATRRKITEHAQDKPDASRTGQLPNAGEQGLRVRSAPKAGHSGGRPLGILPQGACVSIGEIQKGWGKITDVHDAQPFASKVGDAPPATVVGGWIFLGNEHGGPVVQDIMPDDAFDRVVVTLSSGGADDAHAQGIPVKAGDLMGHLGRYDSLNASPPSATRMAHIEVFCDESVKSFIEQSRAWVVSHGAHREDWTPLGLSSEPTLLRIGEGTTLYRNAEQQGAEAPVTGLVQRWSLAELARDKSRQHTETTGDRSGRKVNWWHVGSVDQRGQSIEGWVREESFAGGMVTREFAQKWVDFDWLDGAHDPAHTIFATTTSWVDFSKQAEVPDAKSQTRLSPIMQSVYRKLFPHGDGAQAADDLCLSYAGESGHYPWLMQAASRLIVKHESEWANPEKWKQLYTEMDDGATDPQCEEEQKRIEKLVWWDEVKAQVPRFPESDVFHIHPIGVVGNLVIGKIECKCGCCYLDKFQVTKMGATYGPVYWGSRPLKRASVLEEMVASGELSASEQRILVAMSANEGKLDSVQSYDSEILTAGAMQKTINPAGKGEFPTQVALFKSTNPSEFAELFEQCGWTVEGGGSSATMYYEHSTLTEGERITGIALKSLIRNECSIDSYRKFITSVPLAPIVNAISSKSFEKRQLMDFIDRLRNEVLPKKPTGHSYALGEYFLSDLGRAAALDQSVNRPGYVASDVGTSLGRFFSKHPQISKNPNEWGNNHAQYEAEIVEEYGKSRRMAVINGVSVAPERYEALRSELA